MNREQGSEVCKSGLGSKFAAKISELFSLLEPGVRLAAARAGNLRVS